MKFFATISCLLVGSFPIFGETVENVSAARWQQERAKFKSGLNVTNDQGQLVELTLSPTPHSNGGRTFEGEVKFYFHSNNNGHRSVEFKYKLKELRQFFYDSSRPTVFVTHGWMNSGTSQSCALIVDAYLARGGYNVVVVDWSSMSKTFYDISALRVHDVGVKVAEMIQKLADKRYLRIEETILVGHSLGAHVMGIAGYTLNGAVKVIYGLDPALPLFGLALVEWRISDQDAKYVEIIHTNAGFLGADEALGHVDFYINGGKSQPNCGVDVAYACSHSRAFELYAESIKPGISFWGLKCDSLGFAIGICYGDAAKMGGTEVDSSVKGVYVVHTNASPPYPMNKPSDVHL